jgi:hypothetical protein
MGEMTNDYKSVVGKLGMRKTERPRRRWVDIIKMHVGETGCVKVWTGPGCSELSQTVRLVEHGTQHAGSFKTGDCLAG